MDSSHHNVTFYCASSICHYQNIWYCPLTHHNAKKKILTLPSTRKTISDWPTSLLADMSESLTTASPQKQMLQCSSSRSRSFSNSLQSVRTQSPITSHRPQHEGPFLCRRPNNHIAAPKHHSRNIRHTALLYPIGTTAHPQQNVCDQYFNPR